MSYKQSTMDIVMHYPNFSFRTERFIHSAANMLVAHPQLFGIDLAEETSKESSHLKTG